MPGGSILIGTGRRQAEPEQQHGGWDAPIQLAKKGMDETLTTKVGYKLTYAGPVTPNAYTSGITSPVNFQYEGETYNGNMTIKLTKIAGQKDPAKMGIGETSSVDFRLTMLMPQLDPNPVVWDTKDLGKPATIKRDGLLKYTIVADRLDTDNDKFNSTLKDGATRWCDILGGSATLMFYRIPGATGVQEGEVRTQGLLMTATASGDNLHLQLEAPEGTQFTEGIQFTVKLYDSNGALAKSLGEGIVRSAQETLDFDIGKLGLVAGRYFVAVESSQGRASVPIIVVK